MMAVDNSVHKYSAQYGMKQVIVCEVHARERRKELKYVDPYDPQAQCYFCRGGK